jgi:hypothetical protein
MKKFMQLLVATLSNPTLVVNAASIKVEKRFENDNG